MKLYFDVRPGITADKLVEKLQAQFDIHFLSRQYNLKTYYDTFDWRLWRHNLICEFDRTQTSSMLQLVNRKNNKIQGSTFLFEAPAFAHQLNPGRFRQILEKIVEMRALLTIGTVECEVSHFDIYNDKGMVILRLILEEFDLLQHSLSILPFSGYEKYAQSVEHFLIEEIGLIPKERSALSELLALQGRTPKDYPLKKVIPINPGADAYSVCKQVLMPLLNIIKLNEQGVIADTDSEFLHDFRVAVRKTRTALKQFQPLLTEEAVAPHLDFFNWLGEITGETRDMDVYLLNLGDYRAQLPKNLRDAILPLQTFIQNKKTKAHKSLVRQLRSNKYKDGVAKWHEFLGTVPEAGSSNPEFKIQTYADQIIWKWFKKAVKQGKAISSDSPPESFHKLRRTCKRLRYLIEFFQDIYPEDSIKKILRPLKDLQLILGNYQDYAVQQDQLTVFSEQLQPADSGQTSEAIALLIGHLKAEQKQAGKQFFTEFKNFKKAASLFKEILNK